MGFAQDNGYTPTSLESLIDLMRQAINTKFGTSFTPESFLGTNWYKYSYVLAQQANGNENKTAEIFVMLQEYIATTNDKIQRPSVSLPGLIDSFQINGYVAAVKKNELADAGTMSVCVDVDNTDPDYPAIRLEICNLLKQFVAAGTVFIGTEVEAITLSNGQQFDFKYSLPDYTPVIFRLTLTSSDNQQVTLPDAAEIAVTLFTNINARYRLGWDFEPQRYFTQVDAPWAATILLEWSDDDGTNWHDEVFEAEFDDLFTFGLDDISVEID